MSGPESYYQESLKRVETSGENQPERSTIARWRDDQADTRRGNDAIGRTEGHGGSDPVARWRHGQADRPGGNDAIGRIEGHGGSDLVARWRHGQEKDRQTNTRPEDLGVSGRRRSESEPHTRSGQRLENSAETRSERRGESGHGRTEVGQEGRSGQKLEQRFDPPPESPAGVGHRSSETGQPGRPGQTLEHSPNTQPENPRRAGHARPEPEAERLSRPTAPSESQPQDWRRAGDGTEQQEISWDRTQGERAVTRNHSLSSSESPDAFGQHVSPLNRGDGRGEAARRHVDATPYTAEGEHNAENKVIQLEEVVIKSQPQQYDIQIGQAEIEGAANVSSELDPGCVERLDRGERRWEDMNNVVAGFVSDMLNGVIGAIVENKLNEKAREAYEVLKREQCSQDIDPSTGN